MLGDPEGIVVAEEGADPHELSEDEAKALESTGILEWSATPECDKWDRDSWAQSNPSMNYGFLDESAIAHDCATDKEIDFRIEDLCQWPSVATNPPFPLGAWEAGIDKDSHAMPSSPICFGVDVSTKRDSMYIAACGVRPDGAYHVEVVANVNTSQRLVEWFRSRVHKYGGVMHVALQGSGAPVSAYADLLDAIDGVNVTPSKGASLAGWAGRLYDAVVALDPAKHAAEQTDTVPVYHIPQPALDVAAYTAATRKTGDGVFVWDREKSREDISPLVAVTMAFGLLTTPREDNEKRSAYADYDLLVLD
jgi:phage terminase large subunit-like protein